MKYVDEFRDQKLVAAAAARIKKICPQRGLNIMEVCGTHTQNFFRFGLKELLPANIRLIAGPGCPVCVSPASYIDASLALCQDRENLVLTFGDMLRIPGTKSSLEKERSCGAKVYPLYSAFDSLHVARRHPHKKVVFLAVGFETTAPTIAATILAAKKERIKNLSFFTSLKLIPPAMRHLAGDHRLKLAGFLCPGHVSAVIGTRPYAPIAKKYRIPCCVAGFEPLDILEGVYLLLCRINSGKPGVDNQYARVVRNTGNVSACALLRKVFRVQDALWRGLGKIPDSGLGMRAEFSGFDAQKIFAIRGLAKAQEPKKCRCGDVLKGLLLPRQCPLFGAACRPEHPVGPCMVSSEGTCNAYFKYKK